MMWSIVKPSQTKIQRFLEQQGQLDFSYEDTGLSMEGLPDGYKIDESEILLGKGKEVFMKAGQMLREWRQFPLPLTTIEPKGVEIAEGNNVAVIARVYGLWWLNASRIVYTVDDDRRFGFAYGTLPQHAEQGEELFLIEWLEDDSVIYRIRAFSKPRIALARWAGPLVCRIQKRFSQQSKDLMKALTTDN
ncbi:MAG: DUF1990 domain-containing protein [bacterium]|nr:DUF1990 domain-containing protein [bacterium]